MIDLINIAIYSAASELRVKQKSDVGRQPSFVLGLFWDKPSRGSISYYNLKNLNGRFSPIIIVFTITSNNKMYVNDN